VTATAEARELVQRETEALTPVEAALTAVRVTDAKSYTLADTYLTEAARHKADLVAKRKGITSGAYQTIRAVEALFRPAVQILERCEAHLKGEIGAYRVALEAAERKARAVALDAAQRGEHGDMTAALEAASDNSARPPGRSAASFEWRVADYDIARVPREYLTLDWSAINIACKAAGDEPPAIEGITFERHARISARK
jgi:hypothetical protein